jgi:hypothetical protein
MASEMAGGDFVCRFRPTRADGDFFLIIPPRTRAPYLVTDRNWLPEIVSSAVSSHRGLTGIDALQRAVDPKFVIPFVKR